MKNITYFASDSAIAPDEIPCSTVKVTKVSNKCEPTPPKKSGWFEEAKLYMRIMITRARCTEQLGITTPVVVYGSVA